MCWFNCFVLFIPPSAAATFAIYFAQHFFAYTTRKETSPPTDGGRLCNLSPPYCPSSTERRFRNSHNVIELLITTICLLAATWDTLPDRALNYANWGVYNTHTGQVTCITCRAGRNTV